MRSSDQAQAPEKSAEMQQLDKAMGIDKVPGVIQPLHQIVSRTKFIEEDQAKANAAVAEVEEEEEWGGIANASETAPEVIENDLDSEAGEEDQEGEDAEDDDDNEDEDEEDGNDDDDDAGSVNWEDLVGESISPKISKKRAHEESARGHGDADSEDEAGHRSSKAKTKEPRMKTNKKKAENFFTHANVKNKNRERKVPRPEGKLKKKR